MPKVIVDTNVFLSGILFGGRPGEIIELWSSDGIALCISPRLVAEIVSKLEYKFELSNQLVVFWQIALEEKCLKFFPRKKHQLFTDPNDNFLLDLATVSHADFLISGDKQVLKLRLFGQTKIVSVKEFLEIASSW